jgi:hypothetical protein
VTDKIYVGNADADAADYSGWLLGHFMTDDDARHSADVEIKWGIHPEGDRRPQWVADEQRSALIAAISGRFHLELPGRSVVLAKPGDYAVFHEVSHSWHAEEDSIVMTVRWPSLPGYAASSHKQPAPGTNRSE